MKKLKQSFIDHLLASLPGLQDRPRDFFEEKVSDQLLSPFVIRLPKKTLSEIRDVVRSFEELRSSMAAAESARAELSARGLIDPGNHSIMMSYDFHLDANGALKLIEVNTNASFLILGTELYACRGLENPASFARENLKLDILEELADQSTARGRAAITDPFVAIIDEKPEEQRLFLEFVVGHEWMKSYGWRSEIRDLTEALKGPRPDFIYNRATDFYLERPASAALREAFLRREICLSPNPHEYLLLADKQRLIEWARPGALESFAGLSATSRATIQTVLPAALDLQTAAAEELWARRKHLFFKPKREFGSKRAFKGASISRKLFDEMMHDDPIAQEYVPAPEMTFATPDGEQSFKFDLRCHAYKDRLEGVIGRLYQGQVTNLKTPYGGFAPVVFE